MKQGETLKLYNSFFQSQMALVFNCNDGVATAAFIARLQTNHSFYKYLVKYDVTNMTDILSQPQEYIQLEEATRSSRR